MDKRESRPRPTVNETTSPFYRKGKALAAAVAGGFDHHHHGNGEFH